jgi:hypothetical protein
MNSHELHWLSAIGYRLLAIGYSFEPKARMSGWALIPES